MLPLPPLNFTGGSATGGSAGGSTAWSSGDWTINLGGSGFQLQGAAGGGTGALAGGIAPLAIAALVVGVAWYLTRK